MPRDQNTTLLPSRIRSSMNSCVKWPKTKATPCSKKIPHYIVGDSAYALQQFLLTPYDNSKPNTAEDIFNYHLSSSRINIECTFGDIDARWGIFWRPLKFPHQQHKFIMDLCTRLHNFIIEQSQINGKDPDADRACFSQECLAFLTTNPEERNIR